MSALITSNTRRRAGLLVLHWRELELLRHNCYVDVISLTCAHRVDFPSPQG